MFCQIERWELVTLFAKVALAPKSDTSGKKKLVASGVT